MSMIKGTLGSKVQESVSGVVLEVKCTYQLNSAKGKLLATTTEFKHGFACETFVLLTYYILIKIQAKLTLNFFQLK